MDNCHKFFSNYECKYYPCHRLPNNEHFNCIFCYCPLYFLGDKCGGNFQYTGAKRVKNCADCYLPHLPEYYDTVVYRLKECNG